MPPPHLFAIAATIGFTQALGRVAIKEPILNRFLPEGLRAVSAPLLEIFISVLMKLKGPAHR